MRLPKTCYRCKENTKYFSVSERHREEFEREYSWLCKACMKEALKEHDRQSTF